VDAVFLDFVPKSQTIWSFGDPTLRARAIEAPSKPPPTTTAGLEVLDMTVPIKYERTGKRD
jgi:hypothetical protein